MVRSLSQCLVLLLAVMAALVGLVVGQEVGECILNDEGSLSACVKMLLEGMRNDIHAKHDPISIKDVSGCDGRLCHTVNNIRVHGLSSYDVSDLQVTFPDGERLSVRATIKWPRLRGNMNARLEQSARIFHRRISVHVSADPEIRVTDPTGRLTADLQIQIADDGTVTATPENTDVQVTLSDVDVDVNLHGVGKYVNRIIGNPADEVATLVAQKMWKREWRAKVEKEGKEAIEEAVREKLGPELSKLLRRLSV